MLDDFVIGVVGAAANDAVGAAAAAFKGEGICKS